MATVTKERQAVPASDEMPAIVTVDEMPATRRGRTPKDLSAFEKLLKDDKAHAVENVDDRNERERFARIIRSAAAQFDREVSTTYIEEEKRLYFRGYALGEAPARGRRSNASRKAEAKSKK